MRDRLEHGTKTVLHRSAQCGPGQPHVNSRQKNLKLMERMQKLMMASSSEWANVKQEKSPAVPNPGTR